MCIVASYYLSTASPEKRIRLFGEVESLSDPLAGCDVAILPNYSLPRLDDRGADICFNTCSFSEMDAATLVEYMEQFERICRSFILYEDHSWTADSKHAFYRPVGGFRHWDISSVGPSLSDFKRIYKITAPFHGDLYGEFFEWLYARR